MFGKVPEKFYDLGKGWGKFRVNLGEKFFLKYQYILPDSKQFVTTSTAQII